MPVGVISPLTAAEETAVRRISTSQIGWGRSASELIPRKQRRKLARVFPLEIHRRAAVPIIPLGFTGQQYDSEDNLTSFPFREHEGTQGRWLTLDPAGLAAVNPGNPQSWNRYAYALNNPTGLIDPTGLDGCDWGDPISCVLTYGAYGGFGGAGLLRLQRTVWCRSGGQWRR